MSAGSGSSGGGSSAGSGNSRRRRSGNKGRSGGAAGGGSGAPATGNSRSGSPVRRRPGGADFWGRPSDAAPPERTVRPTADPGALVRSLGEPPLGPNPATAAHHLTAIYEEAVRAAVALAAINGILEEA